MILYHGSEGKYNILKKSQAQAKEGVIVPEKELQNAIYFTPNYAFALAMCSMPSGLTHVDQYEMTIKTEFPENFNPDQKIYIYSVDSEKIPKEKLEFLEDGLQVVVNLEEMPYDSVEEITAGEVLKYYKFLNWKSGYSDELKPR